MERVLEVVIEIDPEDWDTLRHQTRTFEDLMAEIEKYQLSRPFASIYDWFPATVTIDGETHTEVGCARRGSWVRRATPSRRSSCGTTSTWMGSPWAA